jgi:hypothetical protein
VGLRSRGIWVVVQLSNVGARVLAVDGLTKGFLGLWWRTAAGVEGGFSTMAVTDVEAVEFGNVAKIGAVVGIVVVEFGYVAEMGVLG